MTDRIAVVGIGEGGLVSMKPAARALIENAKVLVGGARHLAMIPEGHAQQRIEWTTLEETLEAIASHADHDLVVLASGDPMWFGLGATLAKRFGSERLFVVPTPGAFSLAAARLGWPLQDTICLTVHGRPLENVTMHLAPGQKLLLLGNDEFTPMKIGDLLRRHGYKSSRMTVLSNLGGPRERIVTGIQAGVGLDVIALECVADEGVVPLSRVPGLPDDAFEHDGQITKREVRAATLAALSPLPGQTLWDIGAGSGSIAIEFLRAAPSAKAVAFEKNPERRTRIARNALSLGVPSLEIVAGQAPDILKDRSDTPDTVFVGGGVSNPGLLESAWTALKPGGKLVANAATLEGEASLFAWQAEKGGDLVRLSVERLEAVGAFNVWKPAIPVTQYCGVKRG
jgi:precorrin-6Y C5,15-methyltransferase (decarboxylating)